MLSHCKHCKNCITNSRARGRADLKMPLVFPAEFEELLVQRDYGTHDRAAIKQHPVGSNKAPKDKTKMSSRSVQGAPEELSKDL